MKIRTKSWVIVLLVAAAPVCVAQSTSTLNMLQKALALKPDPQNGEHLYIQYCSACHHRSGWGSGPREVPTLAGQQDSYLLEQLLQFSNLERKKDEMHEVVARPQIASPQSLRDVSAYIAGKPRNPRSDRGDGSQLVTGERVFKQSCVICHGKNGEGNRDDLIPAIGGQQYGYLFVRLNNFARQHSTIGQGALEPAVVNLLAGLSQPELQAVADYASRLPALQA
ncbi:MAG TPA: c-type cytochrome, partial [Steroidobacteraceae bacterium]